MKRHPSLRPLSDDHHRALVLARRLRRFSSGADSLALESLSGEVRNQFATELDPHFRVEESWLLPALERRGARGLAAEIAKDHARLRDFVCGPWTPVTPQELGRLLEKHVRFEERVVFPEAEVLLSEAELAAVRNAVAERRGAP